jgi:hypothetical protein
MRNVNFRTRAVLGLLALFVAAPFSLAQFSFDLDVPAGHNSFWTIDDVSRVYGLTAELEVRDLRDDARWLPAFQVILGTGDRLMALRILREKGARDLSTSIVVFEKNQPVGQRMISGLKIERGKKFSITLDWSVPHTLSVSSDRTELGRFPLEFSPQTLRVTASSGQLYGHSLRLISK